MLHRAVQRQLSGKVELNIQRGQQCRIQSRSGQNNFFWFGDKVMDVHANAQDQPLKMIPRHLLVEAIMQNLFVFSSINPTFIVTRAFCSSVTA